MKISKRLNKTKASTPMRQLQATLNSMESNSLNGSYPHRGQADYRTFASYNANKPDCCSFCSFSACCSISEKLLVIFCPPRPLRTPNCITTEIESVFHCEKNFLVITRMPLFSVTEIERLVRHFMNANCTILIVICNTCDQ